MKTTKMKKVAEIHFKITKKRWYHYLIDPIERWIQSRRKPEHDLFIGVNVTFTKDWNVVAYHSAHIHDFNDEGISLSEAKLYRCPICILYNKEEDICNYKKCKVNIEIWEDQVPDWCPQNNGESIIDEKSTG